MSRGYGSDLHKLIGYEVESYDRLYVIRGVLKAVHGDKSGNNMYVEFEPGSVLTTKQYTPVSPVFNGKAVTVIESEGAYGTNRTARWWIHPKPETQLDEFKEPNTDFEELVNLICVKHGVNTIGGMVTAHTIVLEVLEHLARPESR